MTIVRSLGVESVLRDHDRTVRLPVTDSNGQETDPLPTLTRLILVLIVLGGLGYGALYALANFVEPREREITVRVQKDGFGR